MATEHVDVTRWECDECGAKELTEIPELPNGWCRIHLEDASGGRSYEYCSVPCARRLPISANLRKRRA